MDYIIGKTYTYGKPRTITLPIEAGKVYSSLSGEKLPVYEAVDKSTAHPYLYVIRRKQPGRTPIDPNTGKVDNGSHQLIVYDWEEPIEDDTEQTGHIHASSMIEYVKDALLHKEPWKLWCFGVVFPDFTEWHSLTCNPTWTNYLKYSRISDLSFVL